MFSLKTLRYLLIFHELSVSLSRFPLIMKSCSICGQFGHNKRTCPLTEIEKENMEKKGRRKCNVCGESGHNKRTCPMKCVPCSDQTLRSYCFAGMSDKMAVKMAKVMDCSSIYGETEEYPQLIHT